VTSSDHECPTDTATLRRNAPRIGDLLVQRRLVTPEQMERAAAYQQENRPNKLLGEVLLELNLVTPEDLIATLASASGVGFAKLTASMIDPGAVATLPRAFIEKYSILPVSLSENELVVATEDFTNLFLLEDVERLSRCTVKVVAATKRNIRELVESLADEEMDELALEELLGEISTDELTVVEQTNEEVEDLKNAASNSPIIRLVNQVIHGAIHDRASDIHLEPDDGSFRIRYRVDGELVEKLQPPVGLLLAVVSRIKIMADMDIAERRIPQDGVIRVMLNKRPIDLRVSTMPSKFGEKVVMRVIDKQGAMLRLENLGFSPRMLADLRGVVGEPNGVFLVTGPTGSGKSTTLYACLAETVTPAVNISTIEDPVEYNLYGINQFEINEKIGFTFAKALRALLRQDPDIVMVGEIRDVETAQIAVQAALTGHLVVSTLHTNDAPSAVTRLINMEVEPFLVAASLRGVLAQRLVRRICKECKEETEIAPIVLRSLHDMFGGDLPATTFYRGKGCSRCRNTGYAGRVGIYELLVPDEEMLEAVARGLTLQDLRRKAHTLNYTTLRQDGIEKVAAGVTSVDAFLEVVARKSDVHQPDEGDSHDGVWYVPTRADD